MTIQDSCLEGGGGMHDQESEKAAKYLRVKVVDDSGRGCVH